MSDENECPVQSPPKKKKRDENSTEKSRAAQKFRDAWLESSDFKYWLAKVPKDPFKAYCNICNRELTANITVLKNHLDGGKHRANANSVAAIYPKITQYFNRPNTSDNPTNPGSKSLEISLVGLFAEHDIPFSALDHLTEVLKREITDSKIVENMALKRTKGTAISTKVIGAEAKENLKDKLLKTKFSILSDESTDISSTKASCVMVRFYDEEEGRIVTKFWNLCQVLLPGVAISATGEDLFQCIMASFDEESIPHENVIGFGSDGCNVMMGKNNSVASRLRQEFPGIIIFKCLCHSLHLCASVACQKLPRSTEDLARNIFNFFTFSCKRQTEFVEFQTFCETDILQLLHPSQTRWLSLIAVVERILKLWSPLQLYFTEKYLVTKLVAAESIHKGLSDPFMKLYFLFLKWVLPKFTRANQYFQSSKVVLPEVYDAMRKLYLDLLASYMTRQYIDSTKLSKINPKSEAHFLPVSQLYLGADVMAELAKYRSVKSQNFSNCLNDFRQRCREFLMEACVEVQGRFDFDDEFLQKIGIFKPQRALSQKTREENPSLVDLMSQLPRLCLFETHQAIDDEWRLLPLHRFEDPLEALEIDVFWSKLLAAKNDGGEFLFHNLSRFVLNILSLPHANADSERLFSKVNRAKTKLRNRLITPTMNGILLSGQTMKESGGCHSFRPTKGMISRMTKTTLSSSQKEQQSSGSKANTSSLVGEEDDDDGIVFISS